MADIPLMSDERIAMIGARAMDKCFGLDAQHTYIARSVEAAVRAPLRGRIQALEADNARLAKLAEAVNEIRNSIIGLQAFNWSEHCYPLVEALDGAGFSGMEYPEARGKFGTMLERAVKAEDDLAAALAEVQALRADAERYRWLRDTSVPPHTFYLSVPVDFHEVKFSRVQVDEYIDAARMGGSQSGGGR